MVVKEYLWPLRDLRERKALQISSEDISLIFSNVESLLEVHEEFLSQLDPLNDKWPNIDSIGTLFVQKVNFSIICWKKKMNL